MADLREQLQATLGDAVTLERELGGGGMSRVFVAEEKALGRKIVVKLLPHDTAAGVSTERFKREIITAARLQHPHIVPLLSAGETNGLPYYTMPFVKGDSLRAKLSRGGEFSVNETVHILRDVAAALAYAHGEGVVHRDIKPDNVIVSGGVAVVTDFGVAKAVSLAASQGDQAATTGLTSLGVALGTPAYMSPEQASADPHVDHRADIYSFGCLAYELLTGSSPFGGRAPQQILAAHVTEAPEPVLRRRPNVLPALASLVMKCLEKRAGDRPQGADELLVALDAIATTPSGGMMPTGERLAAIRRGSGVRLLVGVLVVAVVALGWLALRGSAPPPPTPGRTISVAASSTLEITGEISPDGRLVAFMGATPPGFRIFVQQTDGGRATPVSGDLPGDHMAPAWAPDGSRVSFFAAGGIYVVPALTGGTPRLLIENAGPHAWSRDGKRIVYGAAGGLWIRDIGGGDAQRLVTSNSALHSPAFSPDGALIAYAEGNPPTMTNVSAGVVRIIPAAGGAAVAVSDSSHVNLSPAWLPDGRSILYVSNREGARDAYHQRVNDRGLPVGEPTRITTSLGSYRVTLSFDGTRLAYDAVRNYTNIWAATIAGGVASRSSLRQLTRENQHVEHLRVSNDGMWLAYDSDRLGNSDIYKIRADGSGDPIQLTTHPLNDFAPDWSPDDREIVFHSSRNGTRDVFTVSAEGTNERQVTSGPGQDYYPHFAGDGRIVFARAGGDTTEAHVVERAPDGTWADRRVILGETATVWVGASPDGKMLVYTATDGIRTVPIAGGPSKLVAPRGLMRGSLQDVTWNSRLSTIFVLGADAIWSVPASGGSARRVLLEDASLVFGQGFATDGKRLFVTIGQYESDVHVMELKR